MKSSKEIIEILETTYPESMAKDFNTIEDCERYIQRKCSNFEKIFESVCGTVRIIGKLACFYVLQTSDHKVIFMINTAYDKKYHCFFRWWEV